MPKRAAILPCTQPRSAVIVTSFNPASVGCPSSMCGGSGYFSRPCFSRCATLKARTRAASRFVILALGILFFLFLLAVVEFLHHELLRHPQQTQSLLQRDSSDGGEHVVQALGHIAIHGRHAIAGFSSPAFPKTVEDRPGAPALLVRSAPGGLCGTSDAAA